MGIVTLIDPRKNRKDAERRGQWMDKGGRGKFTGWGKIEIEQKTGNSSQITNCQIEIKNLTIFTINLFESKLGFFKTGMS